VQNQNVTARTGAKGSSLFPCRIPIMNVPFFLSETESEWRVFLRFGRRRCRRERQFPDWRGKNTPGGPRKAQTARRSEAAPHPQGRTGVSAQSARPATVGRRENPRERGRNESSRRDAGTRRPFVVSHRKHKSHKRWKIPCAFCAFLWLKTGDFSTQKAVLRFPGGFQAKGREEEAKFTRFFK
jgi:hypothetical protein